MSLEIVNEVLFELRRLGLDYRSNPKGPDGPWRAQCPLCVSLSQPDDLPLTITNRGHFRCRHRCDPEKIAAALDGSAPSLRLPTLPFVSAAELKASTPLEPFWVVDGLVAEENITLLAGRPKAGKSTLAFDLSAAVANQEPGFIGKPVNGGAVVYVSEEGSATLAHKLPDCHGLRILTRESVWPKPEWPTLVEAAVAEAKRVHAKLLVIDTLAYWAQLPAEREKDAGAALAIMESAVYAAREGLAVLLPTHTRKGGGEDGEGIRGSSAFAGSADIILEMERLPDAPRCRAILALSRYPQTPGTLVIELDDNRVWRVVSEDADRNDARTIATRQRADNDRQAILDALEAADELTRAELEETVGTPARQWHSILDELIKAGDVRRSGAGKKGDPYRFQILRTDAAQEAAQTCAESDLAEIHVSAHPRSGAETESSAAPSPEAAPCAESGRLAA
jgi:hypothetical protein